MESLLCMIMDKVGTHMRTYYSIYGNVVVVSLQQQNLNLNVNLFYSQIMVLPKPEDTQTSINSLKSIREFREGAHKLQNELSRPFPFIPEIDTRSYANTEPGKFHPRHTRACMFS